VSTGTINSTDNSAQIIHDAATNQGNSGGPCLDLRGNVLGVVFAVTNNKVVGSARGFAVPSRFGTELLENLDGLISLRDPGTELRILTPEQIVQRSRGAVVRIDIYGSPRSVSKPERNGTPSSKTDPLLELVTRGLLPELTCMRCEGSGVQDCLKCSNGTISEHRREAVSINPLTREPIMGIKVYKVACPNCKGIGRQKCPYCNRGRLKL
jgi:hypothetical protein